MRHSKIAIAVACIATLSMPYPALAQSALSVPVKRDMACYVGLSILGRDAQRNTKVDPKVKSNIEAAVFYYAGKLAARYPGKSVQAAVDGHIQEVTDYSKATSAQKCLSELKTALAPASAK